MACTVWPYRFLVNDLISGCGLMGTWVWFLSCMLCHTMASRSSSELELPDCPSQPTGINFPKRSFGKAKILFTTPFRVVGSNSGNGYTMTLFH